MDGSVTHEFARNEQSQEQKDIQDTLFARFQDTLFPGVLSKPIGLHCILLEERAAIPKSWLVTDVGNTVKEETESDVSTTFRDATVTNGCLDTTFSVPDAHSSTCRNRIGGNENGSCSSVGKAVNENEVGNSACAPASPDGTRNYALRRTSATGWVRPITDDDLELF